MPYKFVRAFVFAILIWILGFIWGMIVFMTPTLKEIPSIPYVSKFPAISFPILILWAIVAYVLARIHLKAAQDKAAEGLKLGMLFWIVNIVLDLLVLVLLFKTGFGYFVSLTVWIAYLLLVTIPWMVGRSMQVTARA